VSPDAVSERAWGREDEPAVARERLLHAARVVFASKGVLDVTIADVAAAAGCTRGTVHRHFGNRDSLRLAFVNHQAMLVGRRVAERLATVDEPGDLLTEAVLVSVAEVRADPVLAAWFTDTSASAAGRLALRAEVVDGLVSGLVREVMHRADDRGELQTRVDAAVTTDAVVRLILSLLTLPAADTGRRSAATHERRLVEQVLVRPMLVER
jgi:AcrR family transcriptional regulator